MTAGPLYHHEYKTNSEENANNDAMSGGHSTQLAVYTLTHVHTHTITASHMRHSKASTHPACPGKPTKHGNTCVTCVYCDDDDDGGCGGDEQQWCVFATALI